VNLYILVSGIISGALYATTGLGVSIVYRSSRLLNFALGGTSTLAVYIAAHAISPNAPAALVIAVACVAGAVTGGLSELLLSLLRNQPPMTVGIASLGVLLICQGVIEWKWGTSAGSLKWLSTSSLSLHVPGGLISGQQLVSLAIAVAAVVIVYLFVEKTKYGLALRMSSSGPITAQLLGVNIWRTRRMTWIIGGALGGLAALMVSAMTYLDPYNFTGFLIVAFVATVLGGFTNFVGVALGGIFVGVLLGVLEVEVSTQLTQTYVLVIVLLVLVIRPNGLLGKPDGLVPEPDLARVKRRGKRWSVRAPAEIRRGLSRSSKRTRTVNHWTIASIPTSMRVALIGAGITVMAILPFISSSTVQTLLPSVITTFIAVLGLNVIVGYTGQLSVGHSAFLAVGAYGAAIVTERLHVPALASIPLGLVFGLVVGLVVGLPVGRLTGVFLSVVTIMLPFVASELALQYPGITGGTTGITYSLPGWLFSSNNQYWFGGCIAAVCTVAVWALRRSRVGHRWIAVRDATAGAQSIGISPTVARLSAFSIGCGLAGLSGALDAGFIGSVNSASYTAWLAIYLLAALIIGGTGRIFGCLLGSFFIILVPQAVAGTSIPPDLLFGVALLVIMTITPLGIADLLRRLVDSVVSAALTRWGSAEASDEQSAAMPRRAEQSDAEEVAAVVEPSSVVDPEAAKSAVLVVRDVRAGYGPISVLRGVGFTVHRGEVTALIGANGAGKTTLLRTISGVVGINTGEILLTGKSLAGLRPDEISRLGIAHVPEGRGVFPDLSVMDNLQSARFSAPDRKPDIDRALSVFPQLKGLIKRTAGTLSGGEQQMVAVARAIATHPTLLMLDEPSLGLAPKASKELFATLRQLKEEDLTVLLIEQNARAAIELADTCCLFAHGAIVRSGPADTFEDDHMVATYLGVAL